MLSAGLLGRALALLVAAGALFFTTATLPNALIEMSVVRIGDRLMAQQRFAPHALSGVLARAPIDQAARRCDMNVLRAMTVMQGASLDMAMQDGRLDDVDVPLAQMSAAARAGLACSPYFGVGWYALAMAEFQIHGARPEAAFALARSYQAAPREAWLMFVRNRMALRHFESLDASTRNAALDEWLSLANSGFPQIAAMGFSLAAPNAQTALTARMALIPDRTRLRLRRLVEAIGAGEALPPLSAEESRPW